MQEFVTKYVLTYYNTWIEKENPVIKNLIDTAKYIYEKFHFYTLFIAFSIKIWYDNEL